MEKNSRDREEQNYKLEVKEDLSKEVAFKQNDEKSI